MQKIQGGGIIPIVQAGRIGVEESFSRTLKGNGIIGVNAEFGLMANSMLAQPCIMKYGELIFLYQYLQGGNFDKKFDRFVASNRGTYSDINGLSMICAVKGDFDSKAGAWKNNTIVKLYGLKSAVKVKDTTCIKVQELGVNNVISARILKILTGAVSCRADYLIRRLSAHKYV